MSLLPVKFKRNDPFLTTWIMAATSSYLFSKSSVFKRWHWKTTTVFLLRIKMGTQPVRWILNKLMEQKETILCSHEGWEDTLSECPHIAGTVSLTLAKMFRGPETSCGLQACTSWTKSVCGTWAVNELLWGLCSTSFKGCAWLYYSGRTDKSHSFSDCRAIHHQ